MLKHKMAGLGLVAIMGTTVLTGCGSSKTTSADSTTSASASSTPSVSVQGPAMSTPTAIDSTGTTDPSASASGVSSGDTGIQIDPNGTATVSDTSSASTTPSSNATDGFSAPPTTTTTTPATTTPNRTAAANSPCTTADVGNTASDSKKDILSCEYVGSSTTPQWVKVSNAKTPSNTTTGKSTKTGTNTNGDTAPLSNPVGTMVRVKLVGNGKIYSTPDTTSVTIGNATKGGMFLGTVANGGYWIKIDRTAGYVQSNLVQVVQVIK